jgi:hypothetical protein
LPEELTPDPHALARFQGEAQNGTVDCVVVHNFQRLRAASIFLHEPVPHTTGQVLHDSSLLSRGRFGRRNF